MSAGNEMIADIAAEFREIAHQSVDGIIAVKADVIADRIEAAWKREKAEIEADALNVGAIVATTKKSSAVGNAAAMREALETIVELTAPREGVTSIELQVHAEAITALSAPPKNCDVGTAEEQYKRWESFCDKFDEDCTGCPCDELSHPSLGYCITQWEQMPYEKGGAA